MEKKPFWRKIPGFRTMTPWKMVVASFFYISFIAGGIGTAIEGPVPPPKTNTHSVVSQKETPEGWPAADITKDTVKAALDGKTDVKPSPMDSDFPDNISEIRIIGLGDGKKNVWIYYSLGSIWDETDLVKKAGGTAIFTSNILYKNPNVEDVALFAQGEFTDQYGKSDMDTAVKIVIRKSLADQVDWKGLANLHATDPGNIYRISENYSIHAGVLSEVKSSEIDL